MRGRAVVPAGGFTLMELLVVIVLLASLVAVATFCFVQWGSDVRFEESVPRFEALLRMARADAARTGYRLQLSFDSDPAKVNLLFEPKPLEESGNFVPYTGCTWYEFAQSDWMSVTSSRRTAPSVADLTPDQLGGATDSQPAMQPVMQSVTFFADGTSDPAVFELTPADPADTRKAIVEMDARGAVTSRILNEDEYQEYLQDPTVVSSGTNQ